MIMYRDSDFLIFLNVLAILGLSLLFAREAMQERIQSFTFFDYLLTVFLYPLQFAISGLYALGIIKKSVRTGESKVWTKYVKGIIMAAPFLVVFTLLFMSADAMFNNFVNRTIHLSIPATFIPQMFIIGIISIGVLGALAHIFGFINTTINSFIPRKAFSNDNPVDRTIESAVFLSLIAALFLLFIGFQATYLFGGVVNILQNGMTYAQYARQGFWELLVVAFITLLLLLALDKYSLKSLQNRKWWFTFPSLIIIAEVLVIIISAFKRLMLYQSVYGMTTLRLYVSGTIVLLGVIFVILLVKFVMHKSSAFFMLGVLLSLISALIVFNLINPDKLIADTNIKRYNEGQQIDIYYLSNLSADAVPSLLTVYDKFSEEEKTELNYTMTDKRMDLEFSKKDWQSYNISREKALKLLQSKFNYIRD